MKVTKSTVVKSMTAVLVVTAVLVFHIAAGMYHKKTGVYLTPMHTGIPFIAVHCAVVAAIVLSVRRKVVAARAAATVN